MNRFGVDTAYFDKQLNMVLRDLENYKPDELIRALTTLADAVRPENNCPHCETPTLQMFDSDNNQCTKCTRIINVC